MLAACQREGSLDSAIRRPAANDFERLHGLSRTGNGRVQRADVGQVRAEVCRAGLPHGGAAVELSGAYGADLRSKAGRVAAVARVVTISELIVGKLRRSALRENGLFGLEAQAHP